MTSAISMPIQWFILITANAHPYTCSHLHPVCTHHATKIRLICIHKSSLNQKKSSTSFDPLTIPPSVSHTHPCRIACILAISPTPSLFALTHSSYPQPCNFAPIHPSCHHHHWWPSHPNPRCFTLALALTHLGLSYICTVTPSPTPSHVLWHSPHHVISPTLTSNGITTQ